MSGTKAGGKKTAKTIMKKYGKDFYKIQGAKGGRNGHSGGFASNPELARIAGAKGGKKSRRTGIKNGEGGGRKKKVESAPEPEFIDIEPKKQGILGKLFGRKNG